MTGRCCNATDVAKAIESDKIEAVIIGSDAVVQHYPFLSRIKISPSRKKIISLKIEPVHYETNFPNPFWGEFIDCLAVKIPVAMMSVSCQSTDYKLIKGKDKRSLGEIIKKFNYISVRDKHTQEFFNYISNNSCIPPITPDPVFAFNYNIVNIPLKKEILGKFKLPDNYVLLSFNSTKTVSKSWLFSFESILKQNGYYSVAFPMPGGIKFENDLMYRIELPLDPLDWYGIIKYSSAYIGEKMHPVIVSLHNNVPFYSFDIYGVLRFGLFLNQATSKIYNLLERADFKEYRISIKNKITYKTPAPGYVFEKISSFDNEKCSHFAGRMLADYKCMMDQMLNALK